MDRVALAVLRREVEADVAVASDAARLAKVRFAGGEARDFEATAFQWVRCYNALEQAALRIAKAFENQIDDEGGWHAELMRRLTLDIPGVRPAVFERADFLHLRELRGFRHLVVHAYDLTLEAERLARLLTHVTAIFEVVPVRFAAFFDQVASSLAEAEG